MLKEEQYLNNILSKYSSRLLLTDKAVYEKINMYLIKLGHTKTVHCNSCGAGQRDIWNELIAWKKNN